VHAKYFKSRDDIRKEKEGLIVNIVKEGWSIINYDNVDSRNAIKSSKAKVLTYGLSEKADVRAREIKYSFEQAGEKRAIEGIYFKLTYQGSFVPVHLPKVLGTSAVYSALAAAAVGIAKGMNLVEISKALKDYNSPKGRMKVISGIKRTTILDDSYNSEPASAQAALAVLKRIPKHSSGRKLAALGDMLELGKYSENAHQDLGKYAFKCGVDKLFLVGERARDFGRGAEAAGMKPDNIFRFKDSVEAGRFIQDRLRENDIILVKASQGMRMEKIVLEIMAEPLKAKELLVRQEEEWLEK
jgi:UDP-N-acetylmuramoyl-tripeptide--D-alanyl-D-alanine ligase